MTTRPTSRWIAVAFLLLFGSIEAQAQSGVTPEEYRQRRAVLMLKMEPNSVAIFKARDVSVRSNDANYQYHQETNFHYLTGCDEPKSYLLLCPEGVQVDTVTNAKEVFFLRPKTHSAAGESLGLEGAQLQLGFAVVLQASELLGFAKRTLQGKKILYYYPSIPDVVYDPLMEKRSILSREVKSELQAAFPGLEIKNFFAPIAEMRSIKSPAELALLQKAIDATITAHVEAMKSCEPEMYEYELQAVIEYCFAKNGAEYQGFPSIVGSGPNSCILHYEANRRKMHNGEVVVMDIGAEVQGYSADVTRTIPVNGTFSQAQREIYEIVLRANEESIKEFKPGASPITPTQKAYDIIAEGLMKLGVIKTKAEALAYYMHTLSHHIGLDVHDLAPSGKPYAPGMVLTDEPGIYIPEGSPCDKKYWNIGVRIEDDVLITAEGNRVLSAGAPRSVKDVESLMKKKGLGNANIGDR
ncbi:MAG: aminopeptidase P N-terminal domain-containing protein [Ignavibacteriales bacterium]|nr:aminopeptidase P N-terminal domain-containing protein [Ignavibacteriales bacterium]